jgi:hypothetical protein
MASNMSGFWVVIIDPLEYNKLQKGNGPVKSLCIFNNLTSGSGLKRLACQHLPFPSTRQKSATRFHVPFRQDILPCHS